MPRLPFLRIRSISASLAVCVALLILLGMGSCAATSGAGTSGPDPLPPGAAATEAASFQHLAASNTVTVPQTKNVDGNTVTIQQVHADGNTITMVYTIDGHTPVWTPTGQGGFGPTVTLPGGQKLYGSGGIAPSQVSHSNGKVTFYPPITGNVQFSLAPPDVSSTALAGFSQQINLVFTIRSAGDTTAQFAVTVPFSAAKTVMINQSATSYGHQLTLDKAVIASSGVRFFYSTGYIDLQLGQWSLSIDGKTYYGGSGYGGGFLTGGESYADINGNFVADTGVWTVRTSMPRVAGKGSWSFTFSVP